MTMFSSVQFRFRFHVLGKTKRGGEGEEGRRDALPRPLVPCLFGSLDERCCRLATNTHTHTHTHTHTQTPTCVGGGAPPPRLFTLPVGEASTTCATPGLPLASRAG